MWHTQRCLFSGTWMHVTMSHSHPHSSSYIVTSTLRWIRSLKKRNPVSTRLCIKMYQKHMGYVDRFDKNCALFRWAAVFSSDYIKPNVYMCFCRLRFKRCIRRYHRAIFNWYLSLVLNNIIVLFGMLFIDADELQRSKEACGLGYKHWFQNEMGNALIDEGVIMASRSKVNRSAVKVTTFLRLALAKGRVSRMKTNSRTQQVDHSCVFIHILRHIHIHIHAHTHH